MDLQQGPIKLQKYKGTFVAPKVAYDDLCEQVQKKAKFTELFTPFGGKRGSDAFEQAWFRCKHCKKLFSPSNFSQILNSHKAACKALQAEKTAEAVRLAVHGAYIKGNMAAASWPKGVEAHTRGTVPQHGKTDLLLKGISTNDDNKTQDIFGI